MNNDIKYTGASGDTSDPTLWARGTEGAYDPRNHRIRIGYGAGSGGGGVRGEYYDPRGGGDHRSGGGYPIFSEIAQQEAYKELHARWSQEHYARKTLQQELDEAKARCLKLEGVIEYLEKQAKK